MGRVVVETSEGWRKTRSKCRMRCFNLCFLTERGAECRPKGWFYSSKYFSKRPLGAKLLSICVSLLFNFISRVWDMKNLSFAEIGKMWVSGMFAKDVTPTLNLGFSQIWELGHVCLRASRQKGTVTSLQTWNRLHMTCIFIHKLIIAPWECFTCFEQG